MLTNEEINQAYARGVHENGCPCTQTYGIDHCAAGAKALAVAVRLDVIRECAKLARDRADELHRNDGHKAAGEVIELRGIARDIEELARKT